jgi:hypothetical protein
MFAEISPRRGHRARQSRGDHMTCKKVTRFQRFNRKADHISDNPIRANVEWSVQSASVTGTHIWDISLSEWRLILDEIASWIFRILRQISSEWCRQRLRRRSVTSERIHWVSHIFRKLSRLAQFCRDISWIFCTTCPAETSCTGSA